MNMSITTHAHAHAHAHITKGRRKITNEANVQCSFALVWWKMVNSIRFSYFNFFFCSDNVWFLSGLICHTIVLSLFLFTYFLLYNVVEYKAVLLLIQFDMFQHRKMYTYFTTNQCHQQQQKKTFKSFDWIKERISKDEKERKKTTT